MYLNMSVYITVISFNIAGILLHQQVTVKYELVSQIEHWRKHITDGFIENRDFQDCGMEQ